MSATGVTERAHVSPTQAAVDTTPLSTSAEKQSESTSLTVNGHGSKDGQVTEQHGDGVNAFGDFSADAIAAAVIAGAGLDSIFGGGQDPAQDLQNTSTAQDQPRDVVASQNVDQGGEEERGTKRTIDETTQGDEGQLDLEAALLEQFSTVAPSSGEEESSKAADRSSSPLKLPRLDLPLSGFQNSFSQFNNSDIPRTGNAFQPNSTLAQEAFTNGAGTGSRNSFDVSAPSSDTTSFAALSDSQPQSPFVATVPASTQLQSSTMTTSQPESRSENSLTSISPKLEPPALTTTPVSLSQPAAQSTQSVPVDSLPNVPSKSNESESSVEVDRSEPLQVLSSDAQISSAGSTSAPVITSVPAPAPVPSSLPFIGANDLAAVAQAAMGLDEQGNPLPGNEESHRALAEAVKRLTSQQQSNTTAFPSAASIYTNAAPVPPSASTTVTDDAEHDYHDRSNRNGPPQHKRFPCPKCERRFARAYNLHTHMATHDPDPARSKPFPCPYPSCKADGGRSFSRKHDLQRHVASTHENEPEPGVDSIESNDGRLGGLASLGLGQPGRKFRCDECGRGFVRRDALKRHHCGRVETNRGNRVKTGSVTSSTDPTSGSQSLPSLFHGAPYKNNGPTSAPSSSGVDAPPNPFGLGGITYENLSKEVQDMAMHLVAQAQSYQEEHGEDKEDEKEQEPASDIGEPQGGPQEQSRDDSQKEPQGKSGGKPEEEPHDEENAATSSLAKAEAEQKQEMKKEMKQEPDSGAESLRGDPPTGYREPAPAATSESQPSNSESAGGPQASLTERPSSSSQEPQTLVTAR